MKPIKLICDNCGKECSKCVEDSTLILITKDGDRMFNWGIDCDCGKKRWDNTLK